MFLIGLGWGIFHSYFHFNMLITEGNNVSPSWFLMELIMGILASSLFNKLELSLKTWIISIFSSIFIIGFLISSPILFGVLEHQLVPLIILGSIQPVFTLLILFAPIGLIGCFLGQVFRNKLI
jgi:hypothetical protein